MGSAHKSPFFAEHMEEFERFEMPNGLQVVLHPAPSAITHLVLMVNRGSRDEEMNAPGVAHFLEHTLFKGTTKRKAFQILSRIDSVGGELNAYTSKEETCLYASVQRPYLSRALELMSDIAWNCTFPEKEVEKERAVILDELASYQDSPSDLILDEFDELLFPEHPLGQNILGTPQSLKTLERVRLLDFYRKHYRPSNMVLVCSGKHTRKELEPYLMRWFALEMEPCETHRSTPQKPLPVRVKKTKPIQQDHVVLGTFLSHRARTHRPELALLNNYFGGPGMNSRLNLAIRERYGYTYNLESSYQLYSDCGYFTVYLGTDAQHVERCLELIEVEMKKLRTDRLSTRQLQSIKRQWSGNMALAQENRSSLANGLAKSLFLYGRIDTTAEVHRRIDAVSAEQMLECAREVMHPSDQLVLHYQAEASS